MLKFLAGVVVGALGVALITSALIARGHKVWLDPERQEPFEIPFDPHTMSGWEFARQKLPPPGYRGSRAIH